MFLRSMKNKQTHDYLSDLTKIAQREIITPIVINDNPIRASAIYKHKTKPIIKIIIPNITNLSFILFLVISVQPKPTFFCIDVITLLPQLGQQSTRLPYLPGFLPHR